MKRYLVWCQEYGQTEDDAYETDAINARDAALKWAKEHDEATADYTIAKGADLTVVVCEAAVPKRQVMFIVSGECVPQYSARAVVQP